MLYPEQSGTNNREQTAILVLLERPQWVVMQSPRLWKFSDCSAHQPPVRSGRRTLRHFIITASSRRRSGCRDPGSAGARRPVRGVWPAPRPFLHGEIGLDVLMGRHRTLVAQPEREITLMSTPACNRCIAMVRRRLTPADFRRPAKLCRACRRVSNDQAACGLPLNNHQDGDLR